jgi:hypothetical protein
MIFINSDGSGRVRQDFLSSIFSKYNDFMEFGSTFVEAVLVHGDSEYEKSVLWVFLPNDCLNISVVASVSATTDFTIYS